MYVHSIEDAELATDTDKNLPQIQDVASGVEYLHTHQPPICHGDLKSVSSQITFSTTSRLTVLQLNILVNSSHRAIITDFGSARLKKAHEIRSESSASLDQPTSTNHDIQEYKEGPQVSLSPLNNQLTLTGPNWSFRWAAPEILDGEEPDLASDVWALGWIAWEVS